MASLNRKVFFVSSYVVWKTELPQINKSCRSRTFSLQEGSELYFEIEGYWNKNNQEGCKFFVRQSSPESDLVIVIHIQKDKDSHERVFTKIHAVDYLFSLSRSNFMAKYAFQGESYISLLFLLDQGECRTGMVNISEDGERIKQTYDSEEVFIQSLSLEKISEDIGKLYDTKEHSDVVLMCDNAVFPAHRNILSARSDVFAAMFANEMSEKKTGVVEIVNMKSSVLELLLQYIYTGRTADELPVEAAIELYEAADKYEVHLLKRMCRPIILGNLSEEVACRALHLADRFRDSALLDAAVSLVAGKADFLRTAEWKSFAELHKDLAMKVFFKFFEK